MAGRKVLVPIPREALDTLHITAYDLAEVIDNQKAEAKQGKRVIKPIKPLADKIIRELIKEEEEEKAKATNAETNPSSGGYKKGGNANAKDKYTVKELKTIAYRNNIKTTKKLDGKTVPLNKKGLMAKLKRNKVI